MVRFSLIPLLGLSISKVLAAPCGSNVSISEQSFAPQLLGRGEGSDGLVPGEERATQVGALDPPRPPGPHAPEAVNVGARFLARDPRRMSVVNATPYRWRRVSIHEYQVPDWKDIWPKSIEPGEAVEALNKHRKKWNSPRDTGAEVVYKLEETCQDMSLKISFNPTRAEEPDVRVRFQGALKTRWTTKGNEINLGKRLDNTGVNFILSGTEDDFYSIEGPVAWMQDLLKDIGKYPLNQIVMPRSHHAGMNAARTGVGIVYKETTLTQTRSIYDQMKTGGVRVLDFRPYERSRGTFSEGHFSKIAGLHHGMIGITLDEIIDDINRFNKDHPGELVILDIHDVESWVGTPKGPGNKGKFRSLEEENRAKLWKQLERLEHRFKIPVKNNVHEMPLEAFIGNGKSAVLIHAPDLWTRDKAYPGGKGGYVSNRNFPRTAYWSDTNMPATLTAEQTATLQAKKGHGRGGHIHDAQWILRLATVQYVLPVRSLTGLAQAAWGRLYSGLWPVLNENMYPNWISLDAIETQEARALAIAMNRCLVAGKCGKLGGKAPTAEPLDRKCQS